MSKIDQDRQRADDGDGGQTAAVVPIGRFNLGKSDDKVPAEVNALGAFLLRRVLVAQQHPTEYGAAARLTIRHVVAGRVGDRVDGTTLDDVETITPSIVHGLALEIYKVSANHAERVGRGIQDYRLEWFCEASPDRDPFVQPFSIKTGRQVRTDEDGAVYSESYPADEHGISAMLMRRIESLDDKLLDVVDAITAPVQLMHDQLVEAHAESRQLRAERRDESLAVDEARASLWRRDELSADNKSKRELWGELAKAVGVVIPAAAKRFGMIDRDAPIPSDNAHVIAIAESLITRGAFDAMLAGQAVKFTKEEIMHMISTVHAHMPADKVAEAAAAPAAPAAPAARQHGDGTVGTERQVAAPPPDPEAQRQAALAEAKQQLASWTQAVAIIEGQVPSTKGGNGTAGTPIATVPVAEPVVGAPAVVAPPAKPKAKRARKPKAPKVG